MSFLHRISREKLGLLTTVLLGVTARWIFIALTRQDGPHPDLASFLDPALALRRPFDTSPREPFFVWWLWILARIGGTETWFLRAATSLWYLPTALLLFRGVKEWAGTKMAWACLLFYSFLPAQVESDGIGLRHLLEASTFLFLFLGMEGKKPTENTLPGSTPVRSFLLMSGACSALALTRVNLLTSAAMLLAWRAARGKSIRPLAVLLPALVFLLPHFADNRAKHADPLYSINMHAYWFANLENIGRPGFPASTEEWQKDAYHPRLNFRQWAFVQHGPWQVVKETAIGYVRCLFLFFEKIYFARGLPMPVPWILLALYALGMIAAWKSAAFRAWPLALSCGILPYAFVSHVFWAGRFFVPFSPFVLFLTALGGREAFRLLRRLPKTVAYPSARASPGTRRR